MTAHTIGPLARLFVSPEPVTLEVIELALPELRRIFEQGDPDEVFRVMEGFQMLPGDDAALVAVELWEHIDRSDDDDWTDERSDCRARALDTMRRALRERCLP